MWRPTNRISLSVCTSLSVVGVWIALTSVLAADEPAAPPLKPQLMSLEKEATLRALLPAVDDPDLHKIFEDPRLLFYTQVEMPRCYQDWDGALSGVHSAYYNISADRGEPYGNGNLEFPWGDPGGTHRAKHVSTFRFLWLPRDDDGKTRPIIWYRNHFTRDREIGYGWTFPVGAIVGEVLLLNRPEGGRIAFEIRLRTRLDGEWDVDVLRPFPRAEELAERIRQLRPEWEKQPDLQLLMQHLTQPISLPVATLTNNHPGRVIFRQQMGLDVLPAIEDASLVSELLGKTPFRSAVGEQWREDSRGRRTVAPTTEDEFHIVPANYDAGFIEVDGISCMRCHDTVNRHVREFQPGRDWYGRVRGSDGIFSFHPFALTSISNNGKSLPVTLRKELIQAGWLEAHDPQRHAGKYRRISGLDD